MVHLVGLLTVGIAGRKGMFSPPDYNNCLAAIVAVNTALAGLGPQSKTTLLRFSCSTTNES